MAKIRVMLVEDHVLVRQGTKELLEREQDLEVVAEAGNGEEAIRLAAEHRPDVILMDVAIPKLNGIEATRGIKATHPETAVLVLTAYDDDEYVFALLEAGAAGYLLKDVSIDDLIVAIRDVYAGESVLHPAIARTVVLDLARRSVAPRGTEGSASSFEQLSGPELAVLKLAARWMTNQEIAKDLSISADTVQVHLINVFAKLGVGSRTEAVLYALQKGWLP
jgi:DNA-binding NarL/FixJ family response regulator